MLRYTMNKRGDMTFQQIVMAALALIVLVVLILIFTGNISILNDDVQSCGTKGGKCTPASEGCGGGIEKPGNFSDCKRPSNLCCVNFG